MEWNVLRDNPNGKIETYNIFRHHGFKEDIEKILSTPLFKRQDFDEMVKTKLLYYYWARCEWEVIVSSWPPSKNGKEAIKIDVYSQVMMNFDKFSDYLWSMSDAKQNMELLGENPTHIYSKDQFIRIHCLLCGTQRCAGPDSELFEGCIYKEELKYETRE